MVRAASCQPLGVYERMRSWWTDDPADPAVPSVDDPDVLRLAEAIAPGSAVRDLGGCLSLNLALDPAGLVLRVQQPFVSRHRLLALRAVRRGLADLGLVVAAPRTWQRRDLLPVRGRWAELETFVRHEKPAAGMESYRWMYHAMGTLHRALATVAVPVTRPVVSTYGPPSSLRRWMSVTERAVRHDAVATELAGLARSLLPMLGRAWIPASALPRQLIHGDIRLGNVGTTSSREAVYLDFGFAAVRPRIHDLAYALAWVVLRPDGSGVAEEFPWELVPDLVAAYEEGAGAVLTDLERAALAPYLAAVPLYHASIVGLGHDPVGRLRDDRDGLAFLRISAWVLDHPDAVLGAR